MCDVDLPRCAQAVQRVQERTSGHPDPAAVDRARSLAPQFYPDTQRMLDGAALDAVYVSLPPFAHGEIEHAIIDAGKAIFVEKPVAITPTEGREIRDHIRQKGVISAVGYQIPLQQRRAGRAQGAGGRPHRPGDGDPPRGPPRHRLVAGAVPLRRDADRAAHPRRRPDALPRRRGRLRRRLRQHRAAQGRREPGHRRRQRRHGALRQRSGGVDRQLLRPPAGPGLAAQRGGAGAHRGQGDDPDGQRRGPAGTAPRPAAGGGARTGRPQPAR